METTNFYQEIPSSDQVREDFTQFIQEHPEFQGFVKVGKTSRQNLATRYSSTDKYEQLTEKNIFCFCASEEIALEVEVMAQEVSKEMETFIWRSDNAVGSSGGDDKDYLVYVTVLKPNLFKCPLLSCSTVMTKEGIENHKLSHEFITNTIELNRLLINMSIEPMSTNVEPIPWKYEERKTTRCHFCGDEFASRPSMQGHQKYNCPKNINKRDKAKCVICKKLIGAQDMLRHMAQHDPNRATFECEICHVVLFASERPRHMNNVHNHLDRVDCTICGETVAKQTLANHMARHEGKGKQECSICKKKISIDWMVRHLQKCRDKIPNQKLECTVCHKEIAKNGMKKHMRVHEEKKKCEICGAPVSCTYYATHMKVIHPDRIPSVSKSYTSQPPLKKQKKE